MVTRVAWKVFKVNKKSRAPVSTLTESDILEDSLYFHVIFYLSWTYNTALVFIPDPGSLVQSQWPSLEWHGIRELEIPENPGSSCMDLCSWHFKRHWQSHLKSGFKRSQLCQMAARVPNVRLDEKFIDLCYFFFTTAYSNLHKFQS